MNGYHKNQVKIVGLYYLLIHSEICESIYWSGLSQVQPRPLPYAVAFHHVFERNQRKAMLNEHSSFRR